MEAPGATGALVRMPGKDSSIGGTMIYFSCRRLRGGSRSRGAKNDGKIVKEKFSIGQYGFITFVEGHGGECNRTAFDEVGARRAVPGRSACDPLPGRAICFFGQPRTPVKLEN